MKLRSFLPGKGPSVMPMPKKPIRSDDKEKLPIITTESHEPFVSLPFTNTTSFGHHLSAVLIIRHCYSNRSCPVWASRHMSTFQALTVTHLKCLNSNIDWTTWERMVRYMGGHHLRPPNKASSGIAQSCLHQTSWHCRRAGFRCCQSHHVDPPTWEVRQDCRTVFQG